MLPRLVLLDSDVLISYLIEDKLFKYSSFIVEKLVLGEIVGYVSSEIYDDIISMLRSNGVPLSEVIEFLKSLSTIPLKPLPLTAEISAKAMELYLKHGGSRKLHYFDSFHVATAKHYNLPIITSDKYILKHASDFGITAINLLSVT